MGHNLDLIWLMGLPEKVKCKNCGSIINSYFDDYDIDCGRPQADDNNIMRLNVQCPKCEYDSEFKIEIKFFGGFE